MLPELCVLYNASVYASFRCTVLLCGQYSTPAHLCSHGVNYSVHTLDSHTYESHDMYQLCKSYVRKDMRFTHTQCSFSLWVGGSIFGFVCPFILLGTMRDTCLPFIVNSWTSSESLLQAAFSEDHHGICVPIIRTSIPWAVVLGVGSLPLLSPAVFLAFISPSTERMVVPFCTSRWTSEFSTKPLLACCSSALPINLAAM